jgi:enoyl-[acyl-carrier protein] reductase II
VDAVITEGYEAGGHNGFDELPTLVLVPQVVDAVGIPVIAAGGIMDARGLFAALALGADGVQMGTRFIATHECPAHPAFKEAILRAGDTSTHVTGRRIGPTRGLRTEVTLRLAELEGSGATVEELEGFLGVGRSRKGQLEGDFIEGEANCGAGAGMIKDIIGAGEVIQELVAGSPSILARLQ